MRDEQNSNIKISFLNQNEQNILNVKKNKHLKENLKNF